MDQKQKEFALEYAGFWIRLGAGVIDLLILVFVGGIILFASASPGFLFIGELVISVAFFVGFWSWQGQTPGKMAVGIKAIRTDSSPITWTYALLRYAGYIVSALSLGIGFIWIAFDSHKQGFHDKIADTYVVKLPVRQVALAEPPVQYARDGVG